MVQQRIPRSADDWLWVVVGQSAAPKTCGCFNRYQIVVVTCSLHGRCKFEGTLLQIT